MNKQWPLTILATQGYPYTGKTTLANALAERLKFSTVRLDDILDFVIPPGEPRPTPEKADALKSHAFDLLHQFVKTQISLGLSVIVDSPLSHHSHLHKLIALVAESPNKDQNIRLVIIECNPKTTYTWETRFNQRDSSYTSKWYKPDDRLIDREFKRDYTDEDIEVHSTASKLVVNTTNYVSYDHVVEAVRDLAASTEGGRKVDLEIWRRENGSQHHLLSDRMTRQVKSNRVNKDFCRDGHCVNEFNEHGLDYYATCEVCEKVVTEGDAAYACSLCPLAIHKPCAEAAGNHKALTPETFPKFLETEPKPAYCFPEEHVCLRCIVEGKEFSYACEGCIFQCHMKCGLLPTVLNHEGHGGRLFFSVKSISAEHEYMCAACKRLGKYAAYTCVDDCNINYHPNCAVLPFVIEHQHCGYTHDLPLIFRREEELEDYICHLCFQETSPEAWYYHCKTCYLDLHLDCAFKEF